jgi:tetratricopeptide (TPR) repeat protein
MKKNLLSVFFAILAMSAFGANNLGKDYFAIGDYAKAKAFLETQLSISPAESNYYLGEIAFAEGDPALALSFYEKGHSSDAQFIFNSIGKAKVLLKTKPTEAESIFASVLKKQYKKDPAVNVAIARAYFDNGMTVQAATKLVIARKVAKRYAGLYTLQGDIMVSENKLNEALGSYEQSNYFEKNNFEATVKVARLYVMTQQKSSVSLAIDKLDTLLAVYPDYTVIYRELARAHYSIGEYRQAIESFIQYYGDGQCASEDIKPLAISYHYSDQFEKSQALLEKGLAVDSNNFVLNRFKMYNAAKLKDVANGILIATKFFSLKDVFIDKDYSTYATILVDAGRFEEALNQYDRLTKSSDVKPETYKELAPLYSKMNESVKAAQAYEKFVALKDSLGQDVDGSDYYLMGREWYKSGQLVSKNDTTLAGRALSKEYFVKADTVFGVVCIKNAGSYLGPLWRGHANAALEPDTIVGLAKPYYEIALSLMLKRVEDGQPFANFRRDILNIYQYNAVFAYQRQDKATSISFCKKMLEIDPANATAKSIMEFFDPTPQAAVQRVVKPAAKPAAPKTAVDAKK